MQMYGCRSNESEASRSVRRRRSRRRMILWSSSDAFRWVGDGGIGRRMGWVRCYSNTVSIDILFWLDAVG